MRVLILGAGAPARELTIAFEKLGAKVRTSERMGLDVACAQDVSEAIERLRPDYVVPLSDEVAVEALEVAEDIVAPSAEAARVTASRESLRNVASRELALPTTAYHDASSFSEFEVAVGQVGYPCLVKPLRGSVTFDLVRSEDDVPLVWEEAQHFVARDGRVLVERFVDFDCEITLLAVRSIDPATGKLATWFCEPIGHLHRQGDLRECWQPMPMPIKAFDNAKSMAARILNRIGGRGLFAVDLLVADEDVYFSGVTPHPHDTGLVTLATQRFSQFDLHARAVLGLPIDVTLVSPGACVTLQPGALYDGLAKALAVPEADVRLYEPGIVLATAETVATAVERAQEAAVAL